MQTESFKKPVLYRTLSCQTLSLLRYGYNTDMAFDGKAQAPMKTPSLADLHCPKNNPKLFIKPEPVTGRNATAQNSIETVNFHRSISSILGKLHLEISKLITC